MTSYELCINLGSFYTTIYKKNSGVVLREPTLAILQTSGKNMKVVKVGAEAEKYFGKTSDDEVFVRPVVEGVIKNPDLTQKILTYFLSKVAGFRFVKPVIKVVVCLPVGLSERQYDDYKQVFYGIGFAQIDFVYSVITASLADSPYFSLGKASLIVDIGAGKTELATVVSGKIINACTINVGGNLVDKCIVEHLQHSKGYIISQNVADKLKQEVGSLYQSDRSSTEVLVQNSSANSQVNVILNSKDIIKPIYENYFKILQTVQAFFNQCTVETASDVRKGGIILIGGGARMLGIEKFFKKILGISVFVMDTPEVQSVAGSEKLFNDYNLLQSIVEQN